MNSEVMWIKLMKQREVNWGSEGEWMGGLAASQ